jgi:uncharacterized protein (DUF2249 family)
MAAALDTLFVPPRPWHTVALNYLTHLHVSASFDNVLVVVDHLPRIIQFSPCPFEIIAE